MGWFWADTASAIKHVAPHHIQTSEGVPPPGCPMHQAASPIAPFPPQQAPAKPPADASSCPIASSTKPPASSSSSSARSSTISKFNPLNHMPSLSQDRATHQTVALPTSRTTSSIPRGDTNANWEYPSPQQMYNAMLRKGYDDTPEDAVESMVAVHNFLNEGAWAEIEAWEARFSGGLMEGWQACKKGEAGWEEMVISGRWQPRAQLPKLTRFMGRPGDMTPKARLLDFFGRIYPAKFRGEPPFDRHDWYVQRTNPEGSAKEVRYVIDYYSGPPEPTGEPVFFLDVRPAVDSPTAACERMMRWGGDVWCRASGANVREKIKS